MSLATERLKRAGVSGKIVRTNPLEGGSVAEAELGDGIIYDTWGGYASRLAEANADADLNLADIKALLVISDDDLHSPEIQTFDDADGEPRRHYEYEFRKEAHDHLAPEIKRVLDHIAVIENGDFMNVGELAAYVLGMNIVGSEDSPSELRGDILRGLQELIDGQHLEGNEGRKAANIPVMAYMLVGFKSCVRYAQIATDNYVEDRWKLISPAFMTEQREDLFPM